MSCESSYNLVKEGDLYVLTSLSTFVPTVSGLSLLYDGDVLSNAYSIPSSGVVSVEAHFGEQFEVCNLRYYASPIDLNSIQVSYGLDSGTEFSAPTSSSGTFVFSDISSPLRYLRVTHSGSSEVGVKCLFIEGVSNPTKGFGISASDEEQYVFIKNSPISYFSSDPLEIPIYNSDNSDSPVFFSVAPTGEEQDSWIYLSTTYSGIYYGLNEYGESQPGFEKLSSISDTLVRSSVSELSDNWDFVRGPRSSLTVVNSEYLKLEVNFFDDDRGVYGGNEGSTFALVHKDSFSGNQSFTLSLELKIVDIDFQVGLSSNNFFCGFTNSWPIKEALGVTGDYWTTYSRNGKSMAAFWVGGQQGSNLNFGASALDNSYSSLDTRFHVTNEVFSYQPIVTSISLEDFSLNVLGESSYTDGLSTAIWRKFYLSYDPGVRLVRYFLEDVEIGKFSFNDVPMTDGCRFFIAFEGVGSSTIYFKNFEVTPGYVKKVITTQETASAYDSSDIINQGPEKLIDGIYDADNMESAWVSEKSPSANDFFSIDFGQEVSVSAVRVKQSQPYQPITVSGVPYSQARYSFNYARLNFNDGSVRFVEFDDSFSPDVNGWDVRYFVTTSGTVEPVTLVSGVTLTFLTLSDRGSGYPGVAVDEIEFYTTSGVVFPNPIPEEVPNEHTWNRGLFHNLVRRGNRNVYEIQYSNLYDVSQKEDCENLVFGIDYGTVGAVYNSTSLTDRSYAESVFKQEGRGSAEHIELNTISGSNFYVWRYFEEKVDLKGFYFEVNSDLLTGDSFKGKPDEWKVQYLREGGSPTEESDWLDVPPITQAYSGGGDFQVFTQYLVDNNDGEYYTSFINAYDGLLNGIVTLPSDILLNQNLFNTEVLLDNFDFVASSYVEFDSSVRTQGARFVVKTGWDDINRTIPATGYTFQGIRFFNEKSSGSYLSPVFDTGTTQNTERIYSEVIDNGGKSSVLYRSSSISPEYKFDPFYEVWEDYGEPFSGLGYNPSVGQVFFGAVVLDDKVYLQTNNYTSALIYDYNEDTWSFSLNYISENGIVTYPDSRTWNNSVAIGTDIYMAGRAQSGAASNSSVVRYITVENQYGFTGWESLSSQRQTEAVYAGMTTDGLNRLFFLSRTGEVSVMYVDTGEITKENRTNMPIYSLSRDYFVPLFYQNKIYVFGGYVGSSFSVPYADVYDVDNDEWSSLPNMPFNMEKTWPIQYGKYIYVLPVQSGDFSAYLKFDLEENKWITVTTLGYNRSNYWLRGQSQKVGDTMMSYSYWLHDGYIYGYNPIGFNLRRFKVSKDSWSSGYLPDKDDSLWHNNGGQPWLEVIQSETLPQSRYFQYKVQLEPSSDGSSPVMVGNSIVKPQSINVPASGTNSFYLKAGINIDANYELWYTGVRKEGSVYKDSIIYTTSINGVDFEKFSSSITDFTSSGTYGYSFSYPSVIKENSFYTMWASSTFRTGETTFTDSNIYRTTSSGNNVWDPPSLVLTKDTEGFFDKSGAYSPCVVHHGNLYKMWYTGITVSGVHNILYSESSDGISWSTPVISQDIATSGLELDADLTAAKTPCVVVDENNLFNMWYEGVDGKGVSRIIYASSVDGIAWKGHKIAVDKSVTTLYDSGLGVGAPFVILDGDTYKMWFTLFSIDGNIIMYSESSGGIVWSSFSPISVLSGADEGGFDSVSSLYPAAIVNRNTITPNVFFNGKLKIYD